MSETRNNRLDALRRTLAASWPLVVVLGVLVAIRWAAFTHVPVPRLQDRLGSFAFELGVLSFAALLTRVGRAGLWTARALVGLVLALDAANTVFLRKMGTYAQAYLLQSLTTGDLSDGIAAQVDVVGATGVGLLLVPILAFGRPGSPERGAGRGPIVACLVVLAWSWTAAVQSVKFASRAPVTAQSPIVWFFTQWEAPPVLKDVPAGEAFLLDWAPSGGLAERWRSMPARPAFDVVVLVLESIRASSAWPVAPPEAMPRLAALAQQSAVFTRAYAHDPRSIKALEALVLGVFPRPSWEAVSWSAPDLALDSVPSRWKAAGLQVGFLQNADLTFDSQDKLLAGRGFDVVEGRDEVRPLAPADGDLCIAQAFQRFLSARKGQRFGAYLWPTRSHLPYAVPGGVAAPDTQAAYLEAVKHEDAVLGEVMDALEAEGRRESTVVVVVGDHGESFGEHPESGLAHGRWLFEESTHVPLVLVNPVLFHGERDDGLVQLKDVAATVAWLADGVSPDLNAGRSIFHERASRAAYLVGCMGGLRLAVVEGQRKFHYARDLQGHEDYRLFDLDSDPLERTNRWDPGDPAQVALSRKAFGWIHHWERQWQQSLTLGLHRDAAWTKRRLGDGRE